MENDYYHSRLDKAKETLMASRRDESSHYDGEQKKKKKHKSQRPSRSPSRHSRDKKKRDRSRSNDQNEHKHKKHHKHKHKHSQQDRPHEYERRRYPEDQERRHRGNDYERDYRNRDRDNGRDRPERDQREHRDHRDNRDNRDHRDNRDNRDRDQRGRRRDNYVAEDKDPYYQKRRDIQRVRRTDPKRAEEMETQLEKQIIFDQKQKELIEAKEKFKQAQKEMEEAKRQDMTILVYCLPLKAKEKDIWNFFTKNVCGKIRDIRIIRDARSGRSKGVAYVEFYNAESVQRALTMSDMPFELKGRSFGGLRVQHSQAEKNRAAAVARQMRVIKPADPIEQQQQQIRRQTKVVVSGLIDKLAQISQNDLKELFEPFGEIDYVDIHRDPQTGACKGYAFIQYTDPEKAKNAVSAMNNLTITNNQKIGVQLITIQQKGQISASGEFSHSENTKNYVRNQLAGGSIGPSYSNLMRPPISTVTTPYLIITSMFKMEGTTPAYFDQLKRDIQKQAEEYGVVERVFVEKNNQGNIWIKYSNTAEAVKAQAGMNGKFFDNKKIFMYFVTENTYQTRVGI